MWKMGDIKIELAFNNDMTLYIERPLILKSSFKIIILDIESDMA